jgi:hypothetical protein
MTCTAQVTCHPLTTDKHTHVKSRKRKKFHTLRFCEILTVTPLMAMAPVHRVLFVLLRALSG